LRKQDEKVSRDHMVRRRGDEINFSDHVTRKGGDENVLATMWLGQKVI
jgi:hypothetical protein